METAGLADKISLLGLRRDIEAIFNSIDIHVLPSAFGEAFPNVVAEAMLTEIPCIVTDVGDAAHIVGEYGWVARPKHPDDIASALEFAFDEFRDKASWARRGQQCRQRIIQNFGLAKMVTGYRAIWSSNRV